MQTYVSLVVLLFFTTFCVQAQSDGGLTGLTASAPINLTGQSNRVIENLVITNFSTTPAIKLTNCSNITIRRVSLRNGQKLGVDLYGCSNITIEDSYFENLIGGIYSQNGTGGMVVRHNNFKNMNMADARGQFIQFNNCTGAGNVIEYNYGLNIAGQSNPEDAINMFMTSGTPTSPLMIRYNYINGGGPSPSGGGILVGDTGGSYCTIESNVVINPGQYGIANTGGTGNKILNNIVFGRQQSFTNVGIYLWGGPRAVENSTVTGNKVFWVNSAGQQNPFWTLNTPGLVQNNNSWGDASITASYPAPAGAGIRLNGTSAPAPTPAPAPAPAPTPAPAPAPTPTTPVAGTGALYRAINFNGSATSIDGNNWEGDNAPNITHNGQRFSNNNVALNPATDAARTSMIRSSIYSNALQLTVGNVPAGQYAVYAYVWEDNFAGIVNLNVQGQRVLSNFNTGSAGSWQRIGPFAATVGTNGQLQLTSSGGDLNISGLEIRTAGTTGTTPTAPAPTANVAPRAQLTTSASTLTAGGSVTLTATASDTDGSVSKVEFFQGTTKLGEDTSAPYTFTWSNVAAGSYSLTAKATDNSNASAASAAVGLTVTAPAPVAPAFYRAINVGGSATTLDGKAFGAGNSANFSVVSGSPFTANNVALTPATDATRASVIRSSVWSRNLDVRMTAVPNGTYEVYLYVWEDNFATTYNMAINGQTVVSNRNSGSAGNWAKIGPFVTSVTNGTIAVTSTGGDANLSGIEVHTRPAARTASATTTTSTGAGQ
ncbi:Ig-like domain-containing protein [Hymenobacter puniceus]|uniref:Ig-like domain-containing protein n=1 Tax=Hymenobacter sp. BT190 TaxID=2763505 RepID=UPI0016519EBA|nr:Ig-like domain-containing protein [Hymenobacter sp. BT190]MBC6699260.1 right-handed parallel beta-helix repeat-containing protein [Hymenobacter sp. BT190]